MTPLMFEFNNNNNDNNNNNNNKRFFEQSSKYLQMAIIEGRQINTEEYGYDFRKPSLNTMEHAITFILHVSLKSFSFCQTTVVSNN